VCYKSELWIELGGAGGLSSGIWMEVVWLCYNLLGWRLRGLLERSCNLLMDGKFIAITVSAIVSGWK
jgi:hypothetical protein